MRHVGLQHAGVTEFDAIVGADLQRRRSALDALPLSAYVAERASILVLHRDGRVDAQTVLAGPSGPVPHARALDDATITALIVMRPRRWAQVQWVHASDDIAHPAVRLLAAWAPSESDRIEMTEGVLWASLLVAENASA